MKSLYVYGVFQLHRVQYNTDHTSSATKYGYQHKYMKFVSFSKIFKNFDAWLYSSNQKEKEITKNRVFCKNFNRNCKLYKRVFELNGFFPA